MSRYVLDASALLALLTEEPGADRVAAVIESSVIGSVNLAEVVTFYARRGASSDDVRAILRKTPIVTVEADADLARDAGMLAAISVKGGLSLGDRFCLALAKRLNCPALTTDRIWTTIADRAEVTVELIR